MAEEVEAPSTEQQTSGKKGKVRLDSRRHSVSCKWSLCCLLALQHRREKPWDHDGIKHWEIPKFSPEDNPTGLLEESSFAVLFPKYRGQ